MISEFVLSLDFIAAFLTLLYIGKLVFGSTLGATDGDELVFKKSLLNQQIAKRA